LAAPGIQLSNKLVTQKHVNMKCKLTCAANHWLPLLTDLEQIIMVVDCHVVRQR